VRGISRGKPIVVLGPLTIGSLSRCDGIGGFKRRNGHATHLVPGHLVEHFPTQGGKIEGLWAVHDEHPAMIAVVQVSPTVAHANPFPRVGLVLREQ
jgi:hypothetical protein